MAKPKIDAPFIERYTRYFPRLLEDFGYDYYHTFNTYSQLLEDYPGTDPDTTYLLLKLVSQPEIKFVMETGAGHSTVIFSKSNKPWLSIEPSQYYYDKNRIYYDLHGVDVSRIRCSRTTLVGPGQYRKEGFTENVIEIDTIPDLVFVDGASVFVEPHKNLWEHARVAGIDYYKDKVSDALIIFDDSELGVLPTEIPAWLATMGREVSYIFNPTGRPHRHIAISLPDKWPHLLDVVKECE